MLKTRKHKCAVVLALSALTAAIIVDANFIADSLTRSSTQEVSTNLYIFVQQYSIICLS